MQNELGTIESSARGPILKAHVYIDLPNVVCGRTKLAEVTDEIIRTDWGAFAAWGKALTGGRIRLAIAAAYLQDCSGLGKKVAGAAIREAFRTAGWAHPPLVLVRRYDVDGELLKVMKQYTVSYLRRPPAEEQCEERVYFILISNDTDYLDSMQKWHAEFGDRVQFHVVSPDVVLGSRYQKTGWITGRTLSSITKPASP